eukprot:TRINITY_DN2090_c0_g1_i1.p1 TRINITY_DN2090_c0_g1~~TRINITY_DN2090_c0_g1_i1.p1  ORF type:complete len:411 (+),score=114.38 TRINITY_DN2090_c0_g1_i1:573-1805(+)
MAQTSSTSNGVNVNEPVDGVVYDIVLGDTFDQGEETKDSYHTAQYNFKPAGIDQTRPGIFRKYENGTLEIEYANKTNTNKTDRVIFRGNYSASKDVECLLIFENGTLRLERIAGSGKSLKVVREIPSNSVNSNSINNSSVNYTTPSPTSSLSTTPSPTSTPPISNDIITEQQLQQQTQAIQIENPAQPSPIKKGRKTATPRATSASRGKRKSTGQTRLPPIFNPTSPKKGKGEKTEAQTTPPETAKKNWNQNSAQLAPPIPKANTTTITTTTTTPVSTYKPNVEVITPEDTSHDFGPNVVVSEEIVFSDDEDLIRDIENSTTQRIIENIQPVVVNPPVIVDNTPKVVAPTTQVISSNPGMNVDNIKQGESSDESDDSDDESGSGSESSSSGSSSSGSGSSSGSEEDSENE